MKNRNKTLTSLAAASMVLTQAGQMSVFAKEEPIKNLSDTEEVSVEKTQKELLMFYSYFSFLYLLSF